MLGQCFVTLKLVKRLEKTAKSLKKYQWMFCDTETVQRIESTQKTERTLNELSGSPENFGDLTLSTLIDKVYVL